MLEIQEVSGTAGYEEIIARAGNADIHITEALDRGEAIGFIAYAYGEKQTTVYAYDEMDRVTNIAWIVADTLGVDDRV